MRKRPAVAATEDYSFIKAYFELKTLRADVERIERSSQSATSRRAAGRDIAMGNRGVQGVLRT